MKLIPKYISITILGSIFLVLLILMGLEILISFISQLPQIGKQNYGILQALIFVILDMPFQLYNFFPMAGLIGSLLGLGVLANQSELIVMQAAGFSKRQIISTVLKVALFIVAISVLLGEVIAPYTEYYANMLQNVALDKGQALQVGQGLWLKQQNNFIHVRVVQDKSHLLKVSIYQFDENHQLNAIISAANAVLKNGVWMMHKVNSTDIFPDKIASHIFAEQPLHLNINPISLKGVDTIPDNMSLVQLNNYINYLKANGLQAALYQMSFWKRIFQPIATAVMILLALPFVFGSLRSVTVGVRILIGVTIGFTFYILNEFFAPISLLYQVPPLIGASLPTILFAIAASFSLMRKTQ